MNKMNKKQMEQDFKKFVGDLFGIDTENLDVNVKKTENGTILSASTEIEEKEDNSKNLSQSLKKKLDKLGIDNIKKEDLVNNSIDVFQSILGTVVNALDKAIVSADTVSKGLEEKRPTTEPTKMEETSTDSCNPSTPTTDAETENSNTVCCTVNKPTINAKTIKEALRQKLKNEKKNEKFLEKFYDNVIESTNGFITCALETGDYAPITEDLDAEDAGISIIVPSKSFIETIVNLSVPSNCNDCEFEYEEDIFKDMVLEGLEKSTELFGFDECIANFNDEDENGERTYTFFFYF